MDGEQNLRAFIDAIKLMMEEIVYEAKELEGRVAFVRPKEKPQDITCIEIDS